MAATMMLLIVVVVMEVVETATNTDVSSFIFNSPWRSSQGVTPSSNAWGGLEVEQGEHGSET